MHTSQHEPETGSWVKPTEEGLATLQAPAHRRCQPRYCFWKRTVSWHLAHRASSEPSKAVHAVRLWGTARQQDVSNTKTAQCRGEWRDACTRSVDFLSLCADARHLGPVVDLGKGQIDFLTFFQLIQVVADRTATRRHDLPQLSTPIIARACMKQHHADTNANHNSSMHTAIPREMACQHGTSHANNWNSMITLLRVVLMCV